MWTVQEKNFFSSQRSAFIDKIPIHRWRACDDVVQTKQTESLLSDKCMCGVSILQQTHRLLCFYRHVTARGAAPAVTIPVDEERVNWGVLKHVYFEGVRVVPIPNEGTQHLEPSTWSGFQTQVFSKPNPKQWCDDMTKSSHLYQVPDKSSHFWMY